MVEIKSNNLLHQGGDNSFGVQVPQIGVSLSSSNENNRLTCDVRHGDSRADLVINRVKLGEHDPVYQVGVRVAAGRVVRESLVELDQLVDGFVADEGLTDEEDEVWLVDYDQLGKGSHQRLVVLHTTGRVDEDNVDLRFLLGKGQTAKTFTKVKKMIFF